MDPYLPSFSSSYFRIRKATVFILLIVSFVLSTNQARATHAMGMDLIYKQISQDSFLITVAFYRDCDGVAAPNSVNLSLRSVSCNRNFTVTIPRSTNGQETTPVCASITTKCNGGTFPGSEEYLYERIVVFPQQCTDWVASTSICCRNNAITTINNPGNQDIFVEAKINNFNLNSSPSFSNNPVPFVCANQNYCFNNGAIDPEGDSLVYSLVTPRTNRNASDTITFKPGYSRTNPLSSSPQISLNPLTGDLCMFPTDSTEIAVLAILVQEYRNGVLVGSIMRDIQLRILGCPQGNNLPVVSGIDSSASFSQKICANSNLSFNIYSSDLDGAQDVTMSWNNGIPAATFNISGGNRPVGNFSWTPTNADIRSQPYCFTVSVSDDNCPFNGQQVFSYCIYVVGVAAIVDSIIDPTCFGSCDGRSTAQVINGIPPFTYAWSDPASQSSNRATGLCAGTFTVTGTDSTGCSTSTNVVLAEPPPITLTMDSVLTLCSGDSTGMAIVQAISNGTAPYAFNWELSAGLQSTDTAFNLPAGNYAVTVTDSNNCAAQDSVTIAEPSPVQTNAIPVSHVSCNGLDDGQATVITSGGTPGYTYQWDSLSGFQTLDTALNLYAGQHIVTVSDANNCSRTDTVVITEPGTAINLTLMKSDVKCHGDSTGTATVLASGGTPPYSYTWDAGTGNQTTATAGQLPAGIYSVIVTDLNNCVAYPNIEITQPDTFLTLVPVDSFVQCFGNSNGVIGVVPAGGSTPFTYTWGPATGNQTGQYVSGLTAGNYSVTVVDSLGCDADTTVSLLQASAPLTTLIDRVNVTCNNGRDGTAFVDLSGGEPSYIIQWDSATGFQTNDTATNLTAGTYSVAITDSFGCQVDTFITITEPPPLLTLTIVWSDATCNGAANGQASVVVGGGTPPYAYLWSANSGSQTTDTAFNLSAGTYFVTVYDSNYCVTSPDIIISEPEFALSATTSSVITSCFNGGDGKAIVSGTGGTTPYTYLWGATAASQTTDTAFNLTAGTFPVTVTDSFNCTFDTTVTVTQPSTPINLTVNAASALCYNSSDGEAYVSATGGIPPYTYLWDVNAGSQQNDSAFGLSAGRYGVVLTDSNNCSVTDSVDIGEPAEPVATTMSAVAVRCNEGSDGMAIVSASGGTGPYTYLWDLSAGSQVNDTAFNLQTGSYSVTIFDSNNCDTSGTVIVSEPTALQDSVYIVSSYNGSAIQCFGDSNGVATAVAYGGTGPYSYTWDTAAASQINDTAFRLGEGVYNVVIRDANGCTRTGNVSLGSPQQMNFGIGLLRHVSCSGGNDGRIEVEGIGGTKPYQYSWNTTPVSNDSIADSLSIGSYTVTMTDTNGCAYDTTFMIIQPSTLTLTTQAIDAKCFGQNSGKTFAIVGGGTPPYQYFWEVSPGNFQITDTAKNLGTGMYPILVRDAKGCERNDSAFVDQPTQLTISTSAGDTICSLQPVQISVNSAGGTPPYTFNWTPALPNDSIITVAPEFTETYGIIVSDANNCLSNPGTIMLHIRNFNNDIFEVSSDGSICEGDSSRVYASHTGPYGPYSYQWNFGGHTSFGPHTVKPDTSTYYSLTVFDPCGSELADSVLINVYENPTINLPYLIAEGCSPLSVDFDDTANVVSNLTYLWQFGDGNGSTQKNPTYTFNDAGVYDISLTITSSEGCSSNNADSTSQVRVFNTPQALFSATPIITDLQSPLITFQNSTDSAGAPNALVYRWNFGDGDTANTKNTSHIYSDTGIYLVKLYAMSSDGCLDSIRLNIVIQPHYSLQIPSAFTPVESNGSGGRWITGDLSNQVFYPYTEHPEAVEDFEMLIFNRWGELIFESKDIFTGWNGYYKNKLSPQEVYVYKINLRWENGQEVQKVGDVTLIK